MDIEELNKKIEDHIRNYQQHQHEGIDDTLLLIQTCFITINLVDILPQTAANYGMIFTATRPCLVKAISEKHQVTGSDGSAVTLQIERLTGATALGSGTNLLKTAFNLKGTAYTTQRGVLADLKTTSSLDIGDSLALKKSGTLTALKGVQVTLEIQFT